MSYTLEITCSESDRDGKRKFIATLGDKKYRDTFNPDDAYKRSKFCVAVISKFQFPEEAHEAIDTKVQAAAEAPSSALFKPVVTMLDTVTPTKVQWLWPGRIAIGKNNLLTGDGGLGKSMLYLDIAARISKGGKFPDGTRSPFGPSGVVIFTMEDDDDDTIVPRLIRHNADLSRIAHVKGLVEVDGDGELHGIDLAADIQAIRASVAQVPDCRLVVVDTVADYLGGKVDESKNRDVRSVLNPFKAMAKEMGVANLLLAHGRKAEGRAVHSVLGSVAFVAQCRVAWAVTRCPSNPRRRLLTCVKNNLADDTSGLAYRIESIGPDNEPVVTWEAEPVRMNADEAMEQLRKPRGPKPEERNEAADWLASQLTDGPRPAAELFADADDEDIKRWTLRRAFEQLGCRRHKSGFGGGWVWELPKVTADGAQTTCNLRNLRGCEGNSDPSCNLQ